jgi:flagellar biogenesis protein FliO
LRQLLILITLTLTLYGAQLLNENLYERENRVDLLLSLDRSFTGHVEKSQYGHKTTLMISDIMALDKRFFEGNQDFFSSLTLLPKADKVKIVINGKNEIKVSKTVDGHGVRIRIMPETFLAKHEPAASKEIKVSKPLQTSTFNLTKETKTVMLFVGALLLLWLLVKLFTSKTTKHRDIGEIEILATKMIDAKQKVVIIGYKEMQYLVLNSPNGNILIDTMVKKAEFKGSRFDRKLNQSQTKLNTPTSKTPPKKY